MAVDLQIEVGSLDASHRRALEEVLGRELAANQQLTISVSEVAPPSPTTKPAQSVKDWTEVYEGLNQPNSKSLGEFGAPVACGSPFANASDRPKVNPGPKTLVLAGGWTRHACRLHPPKRMVFLGKLRIASFAVCKAGRRGSGS